jgi:O-antigen/teichoic acid export membrane protein
MAHSPEFSVRRLLSNTGWLAGGEGMNRVLGLLIALYLARALGSAGYGTIGIAASMLGFLRIAVRMGTGVIGIRNVARDATAIPSTYADIAGLRIVLALTLVSAVAVGSPWIAATLAVPASVLILYACHLIPMAFTPLWAYRGLERMAPIALSRTADAGLVLGGLLLFVHGTDIDLWQVPLVQLTGYTVAVGWLYGRLRMDYGPLRPRIDVKRWPPLLREGSLISGGVLLETVYVDGDVILLAWLAGPAAAAQFLVSHKIVLTVLLGVLIAQQAAFPAVNRLAALSHARAVAMQRELLRYAFIFLLPVIVLLVLLADPIVALLFGPGYEAAATVLRIASFSLPFAAAAESTKRLLLSAVDPRSVFAGRAVTVLAHISLALILIPFLGAAGAAVACLAGQAAGTAAFGALCARTLGEVPWRPATLAPVLAAIAALAATIPIAAFGLTAQIAAATAVYTAGAYFLGALDVEDLKRLRARIESENSSRDFAASRRKGH